MSTTPVTGAMLLRDAIAIPERINASDFVLELHKGVEQAGVTVGDYVVTPAISSAFQEALGLVESALAGNKDLGAFIHGSFGSGKSHFMAVLHLLLTGNASARALPGLQQVVADHAGLLDGDRGKLLVIDYHLVGAASFEQAVFSGYLKQVEAMHPGVDMPVLHRTDPLFIDAADRRTDMGDEKFFAKLNAKSGGGQGGWAALSGGWTSASYDAAVRSPVGTTERDRLASALVQAFFSGYTQVGEWQDVDSGLGVIAAHAKSLGYSGVVLFLDELVLWLAGHLADQDFVSREGAKVAKLVETGIGVRAVPLISFIARQRDLRDFLGDSVPGAHRVAIGQTFQWWESRFDKIEIKASNLADVAQRRLLSPVSAEAATALADALAKVKRNAKAWDALLTDEAGAGETDFAKVYPFSPAVVDTLIALSAQLQRERTALKVMAQLLSNGRNTLTVTDVIPVGDLYDVMVEAGDDPLTDEMRQLFSIARDLYRTKLRPVLLAENGLDEATLAAGDADAAMRVRRGAFATDDRLVKTLIIAALAPVAAMKNLTASRLTYLNYGTVATPIPGTEVTAVLAKVRTWAQQVGELEVGAGNDPIVSLQLSGVDYDGIVDRVRAEDNDGARRTLLRKLVFEQLGIASETLLNETPYAVTWRGTKRTVDIVFGNIRDRDTMPDDVLRASGDQWRMIIDYPFDFVAGMGPNDDVARIADLKASGVVSRTLAWIPGFFTQARQNDLGRLVLLEHLVGGSAASFEQHSMHLPADQRPIARNLLDSQRRSLREALGAVLRAAYGITKADPSDIDITNYGTFSNFATLDDALTPQPPVGATLKDALKHLIDQMLSSQFPAHPKFESPESEVRRGDLNLALAHVAQAMARPDGRVDPVEQAKRPPLRRVANPLKVGECYESHYVFTAATFGWRNQLVQWAAAEKLSTIPVSRAREWFAPYGMPVDMQNLILCSWALLDDKQWSKGGAPVTVASVEQVSNDLEMREPVLPPEELWPIAVRRSAQLLGVTVAPLRSASNLAALAAGVRGRAKELQRGAADLLLRLGEHRDVLGLSEGSARLGTARDGQDLIDRLARENDDVVLVCILGEHALPDEPQALAKSLSSGGEVAAALKGAQWDLLISVDGMTSDHGRSTDAIAVLEPLRATAAIEELHAALAPALSTATTAAAALLANLNKRPPIITPPSDRTVDDIVLEGIDDKLDAIGKKIREALAAEPTKKVRVEWWLE